MRPQQHDLHHPRHIQLLRWRRVLRPGLGREAASEVFCFSQFFHLITAVSVGYILYDFVFLAIYFEYMKNQLATILAHHAIFIFTYFLSQVSSLNQGPPAPAPFRPSLLSRTLTRPAFPPHVCPSIYPSVRPVTPRSTSRALWA